MTSSRLVRLKVATDIQPGYLYLVTALGTRHFKIGKTLNCVQNRIRNLQTGCPFRLRYVYHAYVDNVNLYEMELHKKFDHLREIGEWFTFGLSDVKECILLMRLVQEVEPGKRISFELETLGNLISNDFTWSFQKVGELYPNNTSEQLFESVSVSAESGESVRNIIKNILKCREGNEHKNRSYSQHGKTLLRWLIANYDNGSIAALPEIQKFLSAE